MVVLYMENEYRHTKCRANRKGLRVEKGMGCESPAIPVGVCIEGFVSVGESRSLGNREGRMQKRGQFCL